MIRPRELATGDSVLQLFPVRTPTLLPATHTNSYALGGREVLLVEPSTPYEDEQREWITWARALESQGRTVVGIFATHHHPDHIGGAELLARELALPIWAHAETASRMTADVARLLEDGEELVLAGPSDEVWRVLHTPGHAPGHVCLFAPESRTVIVGDMVASIGTILIAPGDGDMAVYLAQLERLRALGASVALPAHGDPIPDPSALFAHYVRHRLAREEKIFAIFSRSSAASDADADLTLDELVGLSYDDVPPAIWPIARLSVAAHLEKLVRDGRIAPSSARAEAFRVVR